MENWALFANSFRYKPDQGSEKWKLLADAPFEGDCEDFALTVAFLLSGNWTKFSWNVLTCKFIFWKVRARGQRNAPHTALFVRGRGWICNIYPQFGEKKHPCSYPIVAPLLALLLLLKGCNL